jgi:hypothetical protein
VKIPNLWTAYGLRSSPYFQDPLDPIEGAVHPIRLFVGRREAVERLLTRIASNEGSRGVIEGQAGVGKTTFIQYVKSRATQPPRSVSHARHIRVTSGMTYEGFGTEVLKTVLATLTANLGERALRRKPAIVAAEKLVIEREKRDWSAGVSAFGVGASIGTSSSARAPVFPPTEFHEVLQGLIDAAKSLGVEAILVHVDNLENLGEADLDGARQLFRDIRDYLLVPGIHYLLAATSGFQREVLAHYPQVLSIFPDALVLEPLSPEEVISLLEKRYRYLKIPGRPLTPPVSEEAIRDLDGSFQGDLRGMLNSLNDACEALLGAARGRPLALERITPALAPTYRSRLERDLTPSTFAHLVAIARGAGPLFRQTDLTKLLGITAGRINQLFRDLEPARAIRLVATQGRSKLYGLTGYARIAFSGLTSREETPSNL